MKRTMPLVLALVIGMCTAALGEEGWTHVLGVYVFGVRANGTLQVAGDTYEIKMDGGDMIKTGNIGLGGHWEGYRKEWGLYIDGTYTHANTEYY